MVTRMFWGRGCSLLTVSLPESSVAHKVMLYIPLNIFNLRTAPSELLIPTVEKIDSLRDGKNRIWKLHNEPFYAVNGSQLHSHK